MYSDSQLGKKTSYDSQYNPDWLYPISRAQKRLEIGVDPENIPFKGVDCWNHYEVSWLNKKGKPEVAIAEIIYDCHSPQLVESKSLKLYFNSFNNTKFNTIAELEHLIKKDMEERVGSAVSVEITPLYAVKPFLLDIEFAGESLDHLDIECDRPFSGGKTPYNLVYTYKDNLIRMVT